MNVSIETMTGLERRLTIALPSEDFETQISQRLSDARTQVSIPGFRAGKVPMKEVRRRYGRAVRAEVAGELMQASFVEAVQQETLTPAGSPNLEVVKMDPGIDFEFTATFEVFPTVEPIGFDKIAIKSPTGQVTDEDLANMVDRLRDQRKTFTDVERSIVEGDQVTVDFSGTKDGEVFEGGTGEDMAFVVGEGQMIADFDKAVMGMSVGEEKTFDATFPEDYQAAELQNTTVQFSVAVKAVKETQLPELNDEFFKDFGVEEGGEEAFETEVRSNMDRELTNAAKNQVKQQVMDEISKLHEFHLPQAVVAREIQALKEQMLGQFQMPSSAQAPTLPDELFSDQAEKRVRVGLVVNAIISNNELVADTERVDAQLQEMATQYGDSDQVIEWYRSQPEQMQSLEMGVLEDQVIDLILSEAQVEVVESNYEDILNGRSIVEPEPEPEPVKETDTASLEGEEDE
jgi:trigger factor